jgi:hypothetical protein
MKILKKLFLIVLILTVKNVAYCQTVTGLKPVTMAEDFQIQERVLLTLDQDLYLAGEHINFFALTFDAALQIPIDLSSILYVELLNQDNIVVNSIKILLNKGEGTNRLQIPRQLRTGYYYIRAYTNYMKNFGPGIFFIKKMKLVNPFYTILYKDENKSDSEELKLDIGHEGGKIIYGIENKIVFFNSNSINRVFVRLYKNDSVMAETETKNGFGVFVFTPVVNANYRIEAISGSIKKTTVKLKDFAQSGVICRLDSVVNNRAYLKVITQNFDKFPLSVFIDNNGIVYEYNKKLYNPETLLKIELPAGLNKIMLKNGMDEEVSYRLVYIEPEAKLNINAQINKQKATPEDSVIVQLKSNTSDSINYVVTLNLGNANTALSLPELIKSTLFTTSIALLTNNISVDELKNASNDLENINDYILKFRKSEKNNANLDKIHYLPETTHDIIAGSVWEKSERSPAGNKIVYQAFVDSICWINHGKTDSLGRFIFALPFNYQGSELVITVKDTTEDYIIEFENEFYPYFLKADKENYYPDSSLKDIIESRMLNLQVNDAYSELQKRTQPIRSSLRFYGYPNTEYKFRDYIDLVNLEEFAFEIVKETGVDRIRKRGIKVLYETTYNVIGDNPLFIFDGIPLFRSDDLALIPTEKLESIRIVTNKFFFGSEIYDGVIDITSNTKSFDLVDIDKNSIRVTFSPLVTSNEDYYQQSGFRMPRYISDIYFNKINPASGYGEIKLKLPQNAGNYSLNAFGYTKTGEWGYLTIPDAISINQ